MTIRFQRAERRSLLDVFASKDYGTVPDLGGFESRHRPKSSSLLYTENSFIVECGHAHIQYLLDTKLLRQLNLTLKYL